MKKHNHYFLFQDQSQSSLLIDNQLMPSEFITKWTFVNDNEVQGMIYRMFNTIEPYLEKHFSKYDLNQKIVILFTLQKLEIFNEKLSLDFLNELSKALSSEKDRTNYLRMYDKFDNDYINLNLEFINVIDYCFKNLPEVAENPITDLMKQKILSDYLNYLENSHILAFHNSHSENVLVNLKGLIQDTSMLAKFNNNILGILNKEIEWMKEGILKYKPSNLVLILREINPNHWDKKLYLQILNEVTSMVVSDFDKNFNDFAFKDSVLTLTHFRGYAAKIYFINKMVEIRDSILVLMDMHQNSDWSFAGSNVLFNKSLFDSYLNMITILHSLEESHSFDDGNWFNSLKTMNYYRLYKYLYHPELIKYILKKSEITEEVEKDYKEIPSVVWNKEYIMYIFFQNELKFKNEYLIRLRNRIFYSIENLYRRVDLQKASLKIDKLKKSFEDELENFDMDISDFNTNENSENNKSIDSIDTKKNLVSKAIDIETESSSRNKFDSKSELEMKSRHFKDRNLRKTLLRAHIDIDIFFDLVNRKLSCHMINNSEVINALSDVLKLLAKLEEFPGMDIKFAYYPIYDKFKILSDVKNFKISGKVGCYFLFNQ